MEKLCLFFVLAILSSGVLGLSFRNKRQADEEEEDFDDEDDVDDEDDLDYRNEWNRPSRPNRPGGGQFPQSPGQFPGQLAGQFPGQISGQFPGQFPDQFPGQILDQFPRQQTNLTAPTTVLTPNANGATTQSSTVQDCIRTCPVTPEYNPVCGSNGVTYDNPGRLLCAQACGVTVNLLRSSRCSTTTVAPTS